MKINYKYTGGFTLVEIMIVVAIIGLLASIAIPNLVNNRNKARTNICITNLRYIDAAKQQWALENRKQDSDVPAGSDLQPYLGRTAGGELPICPSDAAQSFRTSYDPRSVAAKPLCLAQGATHILP